jgi:uncharacterized flavoprotein (TIGR03862 family)
MAAEVLSQAGISVSLYDAMPSVGRKFLLAGIGGMNLTHAEDFATFLTRYGKAQTHLTPIIEHFDAPMLRDWANGLGIKTFVGSSQRVFPEGMKAAPLLRAWLQRLRKHGVQIYPRHRWLGWTETRALRFNATAHTGAIPQEKCVAHRACVLALGGASWARLGSDGAWVPLLRAQDVTIADLEPSNCGFEILWSEYFSTRFAGAPLNTLTISTIDGHGKTHHLRGECTVSRYGVEGGIIYAISAILREQLRHGGKAQLSLDLLPDRSVENILSVLEKPRKKISLNNFLRKNLHLSPVKIALLQELLSKDVINNPHNLAHAFKALPLELTATRPLDEAISTAGGVDFSSLDSHLMLRNKAGVFCAGEMLDWEAPTGGYLLTACFATGRAAARGVIRWLNEND